MKYHRVLFICSGNMCRSPMAKALFKDLVRKDFELRSANICADSAGTLSLGQNPATAEAIQVTYEIGLDITPHRSKHVYGELIDWSDIVLVMEYKHKHYILEHFPLATGKVYLLTQFVGKEGDVPDPIGCSIEIYRECADQLTSLLSLAVERMKS